MLENGVKDGFAHLLERTQSFSKIIRFCVGFLLDRHFRPSITRIGFHCFAGARRDPAGADGAAWPVFHDGDHGIGLLAQWESARLCRREVEGFDPLHGRQAILVGSVG